MRKLLLLVLLGLSLNSFTQVTTILENTTTKNSQTKEVDGYNKEYKKYMLKSERYFKISTITLIISSIASTAIVLNSDYNYDRSRVLILTNSFFLGMSTTFTIVSRNNRKKAYELKRKKYGL